MFSSFTIVHVSVWQSVSLSFPVLQSDNKNFNRGYLLNIGAMHAMTNEHGIDYDCLVMHDVDKFPEDTRNFYYCAENNPRHLIGQISYENNENYRKLAALILKILSISY